MELFDPTGCLMDDLLDFSSDIGEEDDDDDNNRYRCNNNLHLEFVKEELEWISNKDAFPMVESLVDIMPNHPSIASNYSMNNSTSNHHHHHHSHQSPISVLENSSSSFNSHGSRSVNNNSNSSGSGNNNSTIGSGSGSMMMVNLPCSFKVPGKARSKNGRKRRRDLWREPFVCRAVYEKPLKKHSSKLSSAIGRKCLHCGSEKTPQWRAGPLGPKTLCNACGVRYKSGRLCDEYRPASSPTFSSELHSNSHRKIIEMRKQKVPPAVSGLKPAEIG